MLGQELLILADSSRGSNLSADGSSFDLVFDTPIRVDGSSPTLRLLSANIWYSFPNVAPGNDLLVVNYGSSDSISVSLPKGLYGLDELNSAIEYAVVQDATPWGRGRSR